MKVGDKYEIKNNHIYNDIINNTINRTYNNYRTNDL